MDDLLTISVNVPKRSRARSIVKKIRSHSSLCMTISHLSSGAIQKGQHLITPKVLWCRPTLRLACSCAKSLPSTLSANLHLIQPAPSVMQIAFLVKYALPSRFEIVCMLLFLLWIGWYGFLMRYCVKRVERHQQVSRWCRSTLPHYPSGAPGGTRTHNLLIRSQ